MQTHQWASFAWLVFLTTAACNAGSDLGGVVDEGSAVLEEVATTSDTTSDTLEATVEVEVENTISPTSATVLR